jgi:hypothetical protein
VSQFAPPSAPQAPPESGTERWAETITAEALRRTQQASAAEVADYLRHLIGQPITAIVAGIEDPATIGAWAEGRGAPGEEADGRLRAAYHAAVLVALGESEETARAWIVGLSPYLGDRSPARVIADDPRAGGAHALRAAHAFLAHG